MSPISDDDDDRDDTLSSFNLSEVDDLIPPTRDLGADVRVDREEASWRHRKDVEDLQARQYWRSEWHTDASLARSFSLGDASTLGELHLMLSILFAKQVCYRTFIPTSGWSKGGSKY